MTRRVILHYDEFGWRTLESEAERGGADLDELMDRAVAHFETELTGSRLALIAPRFKPAGCGRAREVELRLGSDRWARLQGECGRQGVSLERLLEHAPLLYLADLGSGRATG